ncbi:VOC family protein [Georgenia sp. TF02-10]|uniref:VOC family protein n=1 Tax=Georgenia sp. TF02-10 TaxID=2917725 RepID=UPI001FA6C5F4|nr:VOC family protein [Georgenia sp. TF02-10]UNX56011.1 VOC family protein [Georgenia sp. TF02-10]
MSGRVVHFEIPFDDGERARAFYRAAFGWDIQEMPELGYTSVRTGPANEDGFPAEPGYIGGGMMAREASLPAPVVTVDTDDMDDALARVVELGGEVVIGRTAVADMGYAAYFRDTEGNVMGLWQDAPSG